MYYFYVAFEMSTVTWQLKVEELFTFEMKGKLFVRTASDDKISPQTGARDMGYVPLPQGSE